MVWCTTIRPERSVIVLHVCRVATSGGRQASQPRRERRERFRVVSPSDVPPASHRVHFPCPIPGAGPAIGASPEDSGAAVEHLYYDAATPSDAATRTVSAIASVCFEPTVDNGGHGRPLRRGTCPFSARRPTSGEASRGAGRVPGSFNAGAACVMNPSRDLTAPRNSITDAGVGRREGTRR